MEGANGLARNGAARGEMQLMLQRRVGQKSSAFGQSTPWGLRVWPTPELLSAGSFRHSALPKRILKLPVVFFQVRETLPYIRHSVIWMMHRKAVPELSSSFHIATLHAARHRQTQSRQKVRMVAQCFRCEFETCFVIPKKEISERKYVLCEEYPRVQRA